MATPSFLSGGYTPRITDTVSRSLQRILGATIDLGGGGGGGSSGPAATGDNYRFSGSGASTTLALKNLDTGLFNKIDSEGADGSQGVVLQNGAA